MALGFFLLGWVIGLEPIPDSLHKPAERLRGESEEIPCPVKKPRRKAGIRTKQGISELAGLLDMNPGPKTGILSRRSLNLVIL